MALTHHLIIYSKINRKFTYFPRLCWYHLKKIENFNSEARIKLVLIPNDIMILRRRTCSWNVTSFPHRPRRIQIQFRIEISNTIKILYTLDLSHKQNFLKSCAKDVKSKITKFHNIIALILFLTSNREKKHHPDDLDINEKKMVQYKN